VSSFVRKLVTAAVLLASSASLTATAEDIDEIVVTASRSPAALRDYAGSLGTLGSADILGVGHKHIHELLTRVPGVWLARGSGQEHLTAIRSPVLTGAGSCGAFLFLEDGIPVRPAGFCNVNQMFEMPTELASSIEVIRGPGNALYGSNALHGTVNVLLPSPGDRPAARASLEAGANEFFRVTGFLPPNTAAPALLAFAYADDGGFRDDSGYRQLKLNAKGATEFAGGSLEVAFSGTALDQETAGFIFGEDAYRDPDLNRGNVNPEAFRKADSQRLYAIWRRDFGDRRLDVRPYLRRSDMEFLQHFLPGQPLEENGHVSAGFLSMLSGQNGRTDWNAGIDVDVSDVFLRQTQDGPTEGSDFLVETRPAGKHYDFDVTGLAVAGYVQADIALGNRWSLDAGVRAEYNRYDYDNRMLDGNTRDDGTECGFGGCLYSRPADRTDSFTNVAPKLALRLATDPNGTLYLALSRGFRAPQMTELYRLQSGQSVADLGSEQLDNVELGFRHSGNRHTWHLSAFAMQKKNSVYRDAEGFNVSGGRTRHEGAEFGLDWSLTDAWRIDVNLSYARHSYDFDTVASRGETFVSGRDVDTAPRWLGSAELFYEPNSTWMVAAQVTGIDAYYLDAENRYTYPGHVIGNLRASMAPTDSLQLVFRLNNVTDEAYADRADFAFGNYRYFPGRGRELFVELRYTIE
jgi:outer membrane receptor protein involved in Fe transport